MTVLQTAKNSVAASLRRFRELQGNPDYLARGIAVGVFIGFMPVSPVKSILILILTLLLSGSTIAGIATCSLICNPLSYAPLYYAAWYVGDKVLPGRASWEVLRGTMETIGQAGLAEGLALATQVGGKTVYVMLVGGSILALPAALLSYPLARYLFARRNSPREKKKH